MSSNPTYMNIYCWNNSWTAQCSTSYNDYYLTITTSLKNSDYPYYANGLYYKTCAGGYYSSTCCPFDNSHCFKCSLKCTTDSCSHRSSDCSLTKLYN